MKQRRLAQIVGVLSLFCMGAALLGACHVSGPDGWDSREEGTYYLADGEAVTGWLELDSQQYYFSSDGVMVTGLMEIDGETYYFLEDGSMATGWQEIDGKISYFRESGSRVSGWLSLDGRRYYLDADGAAVAGPVDVDGTVYLFDSQGQLTSGWTEVDGKRCYGDENGHPVTGWQEIDGTRYCFDESGFQLTGWLEYGSFSYYYLESGEPARGAVTVDGEKCYFASTGQQIILVNPWNQVPEGYTVELQAIDANHQVAAIAYEDFLEMMDDCRNAGLHPVVCSSYRTQEYQEKLYSRKVAYYTGMGYSEEEARELAGHSVAVPGTSEHQLGLALDIIDNSNWNLNESQAKTATQQWLMAHSWEYGWILRYPDGSSEQTGIIFEPWHYRYVGREVAEEIHELGVCLEEYLEMLSANGE